jgi:hypothetical protein
LPQSKAELHSANQYNTLIVSIEAEHRNLVWPNSCRLVQKDIWTRNSANPRSSDLVSERSRWAATLRLGKSNVRTVKTLIVATWSHINLMWSDDAETTLKHLVLDVCSSWSSYE